MSAFAHRIIFVRHGETPYNAENRLQGQRDIPLAARGRDQARAVGRALRDRIGAEIDRLEAAQAFVASPLLRTRETMELARAAMGLTPAGYRLDPALVELTFGDWEGLTWPEVKARDPKAPPPAAPTSGISPRPAARAMRCWRRGCAAGCSRWRKTFSSSRMAASPGR